MTRFYTLLIILFSSSSFSQTSDLINEMWYLQKLVIDGVDSFPPENASLPHVPLFFSEDYTMSTSVCNTGFGDVNFVEDGIFSLDFFAVTLSFCIDESNNLFDAFYLGDYFQQNSTSQFTYTVISGEDDLNQLTITNAQNNQAIYYNQNLAAPDFEKNNWSFYPNPAKDIVYFKNENFQKESVEIYDALGKLCISKTIDINDTAVNTANLAKGIYLLKIFSDNGIFSRKFIKE